MDKFISAEEYAKMKSKQDEMTQEITQNLTEEEQLDLAFAMMSGDKDEILGAFDKILDKVLKNERFIEMQNQLKGAIIEQEMSLEKFNETVTSLKNLPEAKENASSEELALYQGLMEMLEKKVSFGEANMTEISSDILLLNGLLEETNSSFESLKTYSKDTEILSMNLTSIEPETGIKHEFIVSLEEDKIYHKTTNLDNSFTQEEEYVSDKKIELGLEDNDGMSL